MGRPGRKPKPWWDKDSKKWRVVIGGIRHDLAAGHENEDAATLRFHQLLGGMAELEKREAAGPTVRDLIKRLLAHAIKHVAPETYVFYLRHLGSFDKRHGTRPALEIRPYHVTEWCEAHPWGQSTRASAIGCVKRVYRWSKRQGIIDSNPIADLEKPRVKVRENIMTADQFRLILSTTTDQPWRDLLEGLWETGCRPSELSTVAAKDLDLDNGVMHVKNKTRNHKGATRPIYLTAKMTEIVKRLAAIHPTGPLFINTKGKPWTRNSMYCRFARIRKALNFGGEATAYATRHLYATDALEKEVPIATVAELLGHTDTKMISRIYSHLRDRKDHLKAAANKIRNLD
jgi:integrase/recombinase XerC